MQSKLLRFVSGRRALKNVNFSDDASLSRDFKST